jgi:hypothetical protein
MKKLNGSDIITLVKTSMLDKELMHDLTKLAKNDFDSEDLIVNLFFKEFPQGFASNRFAQIEKTKLVNVLSKLKKEIYTHGLRKAHSLVQNFRNSSNEAVVLENETGDFNHSNSSSDKIKAAGLISFLSKYIDGETNKQTLASSLNDIKLENYDEAGNKIHKVFSSLYPEKNIKLAFTTLKNQMGESYQLCAKGIYNYGSPVPMALSNCRDYCIDVRKNPDGTIGCNYLKWMNENLITNEQAMNLFDKMSYGSDYETNNLEKGERTKFPMSDQNSQDKRINRDEDLTKKVTLKPWEEQLEDSHSKEKTIKVKQKNPISDEAIEELLFNAREVFDDQDLDTLEEQIQAMMGD